MGTTFEPSRPASRAESAAIRLAGAIALAGVAIHLGAIVGGPSWYAFFGAPPRVVESARVGTLLAPLGAGAIAGAMGLCAAYAFSAAGVVPRLPLLRTGLASIAAVCLVRALAIVPMAVVFPALRGSTFEWVAAAVWGVAGLGFTAGFRRSWRLSRAPCA